MKVGSVECGKLVDWAACVCATIDYPGLTATWSAMFAHLKCSVNSCPCDMFCVQLHVVMKCDNNHISTYCTYMCRIGLCARVYASVMVVMVLT